MQLLKINDMERGTAYLSTDDISSMFYDEEENATIICMKSKLIFGVESNVLLKLVKLVSQTTNSNLLYLE